MINQSYKYRLHYLLRQLSYEDYQVAMKFLPEFLGKDAKTLEAWIYRKSDDSAEIPADSLLKLSAFFQVPIETIHEKTIVSCWDEVKEQFLKFKETFPIKLVIPKNL